MAIHQPKIHTYHCICTSLLLTSTHKLSSLPRRITGTGGLDSAIILPLPSAPPILEDDEQDDEREKQEGNGSEQTSSMPAEGYSILLGMNQDKNITIVRREDGFEKRLLWRCSRCRLVVGYDIPSRERDLDRMDLDDEGRKGKESLEESYTGRVIYLLPGGFMSTKVMAAGGVVDGSKKIDEEQVDLKQGTMAAFE